MSEIMDVPTILVKTTIVGTNIMGWGSGFRVEVSSQDSGLRNDLRQ
jgi:hypothetical protein